MRKEPTSGLIIGDGIVDKRGLGRSRKLGSRSLIVRILPGVSQGLQHREPTLLQQSKLLVVADQRAAGASVVAGRENIPAEKPARIAPIQQTEQSRSVIYFAVQRRHRAGRDLAAGRANDQRDVVALHRQFGFSGARCAVVGDDHKNRVFEPGPRRRLAQKLADGIYERTFLCSLPPECWPDYAARMARLLRPGGVLAGIFYYGTDPDGYPSR